MCLGGHFHKPNHYIALAAGVLILVALVLSPVIAAVRWLAGY